MKEKKVNTHLVQFERQLKSTLDLIFGLLRLKGIFPFPPENTETFFPQKLQETKTC